MFGENYDAHRLNRCKERKSRLMLFLTISITLISSIKGADVSCPRECICRLIPDAEMSTILSIVCPHGDMHTIPTEYFDHSARVIIISAPKDHPNFLTIGPVFIQPIPFLHLREIHIVNSNIPTIGQHSFWGLQHLRWMNLTYNKITSIRSDNFRGLLNLTELNLDYNNIENMPSECFNHLTALRKLTLTNNRISHLVPRLFRMLANLSHLDISYNPLHDLNPEIFKDIQNLSILKCRRCFLRRINTQIYYLTNRLKELDLGENQFKYLTSDEFISLKKLQTLKLDGNQLSVIVDNMFGRNRELQTLSLEYNRLALLAPAALTNLTSLAHLDISYNKIHRFHLETFAPLVESIKTINFSGNNVQISEIAIVLQIFPEILNVGLADLSLEHIPENLFTYNRHLATLDLSRNKLRKFPFKLLAKTRFLQSLNISRNTIESLKEEDLQRLEAIAQVDLSKNLWRCDQCSVGLMLVYMSTSVLNETIRHLTCDLPLRLRKIKFENLTLDVLDPCPSSYEAQLTVIAGLLLLFIALFSTIAAALCCTCCRAAHYYTNEEKGREHEHEHPELLSHTDVSNIATIHAPYHLVSKRS